MWKNNSLLPALCSAFPSVPISPPVGNAFASVAPKANNVNANASPAQMRRATEPAISDDFQPEVEILILNPIELAQKLYNSGEILTVPLHSDDVPT
jgi:hypothetical protein